MKNTYYGSAYNSYGLDRPIRKGDRVEVLDSDDEQTVIWTGTVTALRLSKASEGYTVLVTCDDTPVWPTKVWARPDELRQVRS